MTTRLNCQWRVDVPMEKSFECDDSFSPLMRMDVLITTEIPPTELRSEDSSAQWAVMSRAEREQRAFALQTALIRLLPSVLKGEELQRNLYGTYFEQSGNRCGHRFTFLWNYPRVSPESSELVAVSRPPEKRLHHLRFKHSAFLAIRGFVTIVDSVLLSQHECSVMLWCSLDKEGDELSYGIHDPEAELKKMIAELDALFIGTVTRNSPQWQLLEILRAGLGALAMIEHLPSRAIADAMYSGLFEAMGAGDIPTAEWRYIKRCAYESAQGHTEASPQEPAQCEQPSPSQ